MTDYIRQLICPRFPSERVEAQRLLDSFESDAYVDEGVVRWNSNDSVPPHAVLLLWEHGGKKFDLKASLSMLDAETSCFVAQYACLDRKRTLDGEQLQHMRCALGAGVEVVDVISGRRTRL